ncbi:unnamed protein product, partial [Meganyctiphanes norvegica]
LEIIPMINLPNTADVVLAGHHFTFKLAHAGLLSSILSTSRSAGGPNNAIEDVIRVILQSVQVSMKAPENALDPLPVEKQTINILHPAATVTCDLLNMKLKGLSDFNVDTVQVILERRKVSVDLSFEELSLTGDYELKAKLIKVIPFNTNGPFIVTTQNSKMKISFLLKEKLGCIDVGKVTSEMTFGQVECQLPQLRGGGMVSRALSRQLTQILQRERVNLERQFSQYLKTLLSNELNQINPAQLAIMLQLLQMGII